MKKNNPYHIVKSRYMTEKARVLESLKDATSSACLKRCQTPKYLFLVDKKATKLEIKRAIETIYRERQVKVTKVNTIQVSAKPRRVRGRKGFKSAFKKAIVSFQEGDFIEDEV